jgi:hypothetical protein
LVVSRAWAADLCLRSSVQVGLLQRLMERRLDALNDQTQAALAEQRHVTKVLD